MSCWCSFRPALPLLSQLAMLPDDFFFQAEGGIRDGHVTGVQTCALPILRGVPGKTYGRTTKKSQGHALGGQGHLRAHGRRSEERRVGKECRSRWGPDHYRKRMGGRHILCERGWQRAVDRARRVKGVP